MWYVHQQSVSTGLYVGVKFEKSPAVVPLTEMFVGIEPEMLFHLACAVVSLARMVAGCQIGGKEASLVADGA